MSVKKAEKRAVMEAKGIRLREDSDHFAVTVREGEIIGLAGLEGHGQQCFLRCLCGLYRPFEGEVRAFLQDGSSVLINSLHKAARAGIIYLPRERKTKGILPSLSVLDNFSIATLHENAALGFIKKRTLRDKLNNFRERFSMIYSSLSAPITSLSGGNQQKVLLSRWLAVSPHTMLLDDPTRGVDVATKETLYRAFREIVENENKTLILLSTEIEEFIQLCERTLVFHAGNLFAELVHDHTTRENIMSAMFGRTHES
jgi:ribose transport system ATP-binding protein